MKSLLAIVLLVTACVGGVSANEASDDDNSPDPGQAPPFSTCFDSSQCVPAAATCCECPTFATNTDDPKVRVCEDVECPATSCAETVEASCNLATNECELSCRPMQCDLTCADGFAIEANGCLSCACAGPPMTADACTVDTDCARTRGDCCGCENGGIDTAVPEALLGSFDGGLMCPADPACPGVNTCSSAEAPRCVQGQCALLPDEPGNACGRPELPACAPNEVCTVNASDQANLYGVGLCTPR